MLVLYLIFKYAYATNRDTKKGELLFELFEHINSNEDPQVSMPQWLQEINRGTFAKSRFHLHSNQLLKLYLDMYEQLEEEEAEEEGVDFDDFQAAALEILNGAYNLQPLFCCVGSFSISLNCTSNGTHSTQRVQHNHSVYICTDSVLRFKLELIASICFALQLLRSIIPTKEKANVFE